MLPYGNVKVAFRRGRKACSLFLKFLGVPKGLFSRDACIACPIWWGAGQRPERSPNSAVGRDPRGGARCDTSCNIHLDRLYIFLIKVFEESRGTFFQKVPLVGFGATPRNSRSPVNPTSRLLCRYRAYRRGGQARDRRHGRGARGRYTARFHRGDSGLRR